MELNPLYLSAALFILILLVYLTARSLYLNWRQEKNLLRRTEQWATGTDASAYGTAPQKRERGLLWFLFGLPGARKVEKQESIYSGTPIFYQRAGIYDAASLRLYQALRYLCFILPFVGLGVFYVTTAQPYNHIHLLFTFAGSCLGYFLPLYWLKFRAHQRKKQLYRTFPDAIDLLMVCVQAGMGFDSAINRVAREIHVTSPELAKEFRILTLELKTGKPRDVCLRSLAHRTDLSDIDNLVNLLIQAERYGTGVASALAVHADDMRQKRLAKMEELAAKLPVKLVVPLVLFIFPAMFVVIVGPAAIQIIRHFMQR